MQRHLKLILGLLLIAVGAYIVINATTGEAQATNLVALPAPPQVQQDGTPILSEAADIRPMLDAIGRNRSGGFLAKDFEYGTLHAFVSDGDEGEILVYRYNANDGDFDPLDCAWSYFDGETANIFTDEDSVLRLSGPITPLKFLNHYHCSSYTFTFNDPTYTQELFYLGRSIRNNVTEFQPTVQQMIANNGVPITTANTLTALQSTSADIPSEGPVIASQDRTFLDLSGGKASQSYTTGPVVAVASSQPKNFILREGGEPRYLIEVWRYGEYNTPGLLGGVSRTKIGLRAWLIEGTQYVNLWPYVAAGPNLSYVSGGNVLVLPPEGIPTKQLFIIPRGEQTTVQLSNAIQNPGRGPLFVTLGTNSAGSLTSIAFDTSQDAKFYQANTFRLKFSANTTQLISNEIGSANDPFTSNEIYTSTSITLRGTNGESVKMVRVDGQSISPFFKTQKELAPGSYEMTISVSGMKEVKQNIEVSGQDLSQFSDSQLLPGDVKEIILNVGQVIPDPCTKCQDLQACFACVNAKVVEEYE